MRLFFSILLTVCFLHLFSQNDSIKNKLTVGISPILIFSPTPDIFYLEFQPKPKYSIEIGGGTYDMFNVYFGRLPFKQTSGFTIRTGVKFYKKTLDSHKCIWHEFLFFFRQTLYNRRYYSNDGHIDGERRLIGDGSWLTSQNIAFQRVGSEVKNVFAVEWLRGVKYFIGKKHYFAADIYTGFGVRVMVRSISITEAHSVSGTPYPGPTPPFKESIIQLLPTLHFGIRLSTN